MIPPFQGYSYLPAAGSYLPYRAMVTDHIKNILYDSEVITGTHYPKGITTLQIRQRDGGYLRQFMNCLYVIVYRYRFLFQFFMKDFVLLFIF